MTCHGERITGYVDEVLDPAVRAEVEVHLTSCGVCQEQVAAERELRRRLRALPPVVPGDLLEARVRRRLARERLLGRARLALLAAGLVLGFVGLRGWPPLVAWEVARDHAHCFAAARLPAELWSGDPARVSAWIEAHGQQAPLVPGTAGGLELVGARFCPLLTGAQAPHLYYSAADGRHVSLFLVPHRVAMDARYERQASGEMVHLLRREGVVVALVGAPADVAAVEGALASTVAWRLPDAVLD